MLGGVHVVSPAPNLRHQTIALRLAAALLHRIETTGLGRVFIAPADVVLGEHDVVQPDVFAVLRGNCERLDGRCLLGPPDLAIEVLSPATAARDRELQLRRYEVCRVPETWLVDPQQNRIEQFALHGDYRELPACTERIQLAILPEITLLLAPIWAD